MKLSFVKIKSLFAPWILVIVGIIFNIFAAIITHNFIAANNEQLRVIEKKIANIELRINTAWQNRQNVEAKKKFMLLYSQAGKQTGDRFVQDYIQQAMLKLIQDYRVQVKQDLTFSDPEIVNILEQVKALLLEEINDIYLDQIGLEAQKHPINRANARLMSLALFLQLLGLILVLARDIRRG